MLILTKLDSVEGEVIGSSCPYCALHHTKNCPFSIEGDLLCVPEDSDNFYYFKEVSRVELELVRRKTRGLA